MKDAHLQLRCNCRRRLLQTLVAIRPQIPRVAVRLVHRIPDRQDIARHRLVEVLRKRLTVSVRAQVLHVCHNPRTIRPVVASRKHHILATLVHILAVLIEPAIQQPAVVRQGKVVPVPAIPERRRLLPSALREVLRPHGHIRAATQHYIDLLAQH